MKASHFLPVLALTATLSAQAQVPVPSPPTVDARAYLVVDFNSGAELAGANAGEAMEPASITKLMSVYVAFTELRAGRLAMDDRVLISERAWRMPGSRMFVDVNTRVRLEDMLRGIIIQSGNDATVALAEHIAGTEEAFAEMMNAHAQRLGMNDSHFTNSTGMPDAEMYTTARDIATLTIAMIRDFPEDYALYSEREFTWNNIRQTNRNMLLWRDSTVDGVKTGHTESAGYCLVTSALRNEQRLVSVVFGTRSERARADISLALLNYGFRFFETHRLYAAGTELAEARVWKGTGEAVPVGLQEDLWITIPRGSYRNLTAAMDMQSQLVAPVDTEQEVGRVRVTLNDELVAERTLHTLAPVAEGSIWRRAVDTVLLWFE
ncbi:MAG: D-alanyl-D-alanine carboxypeptidase [Xanthomonadaceae bacterium]|nr:D-alanyl-D-alanine carboxypeptidase [Xanthomonadaceae bacterium]